MPYIPKSDRRRLWCDDADPACNVGELTFVLYKTCLEYLDMSGGRYCDYAECLAALEGAKLEFYRRHVAPYEDKKIAENGDVT